MNFSLSALEFERLKNLLSRYVSTEDARFAIAGIAPSTDLAALESEHALAAEVRLYDHLCRQPDPNDVPEGVDWKTTLNPSSLEIIPQAMLEPSLASAAPGDKLQFERLGYFCVDSVDSQPGRPIFNRAVTLRDSWAKAQKKEGGASDWQLSDTIMALNPITRRLIWVGHGIEAPRPEQKPALRRHENPFVAAGPSRVVRMTGNCQKK